MRPLNIAVVGSGIGAIASAYDLKKMGHKVTLFEKNDYFGGHTHTHHFELNDHKYTVDTGFLVHNDRTYPNLISFFEELNIETVASDMSFSVHLEDEKLEWSGTNLFTVFCQKRNLFRPRFYRFLKEIMRFNKMADELISESRDDISLSLGDILKRHSFGEDFQNWYLLPMGGCIWSTPTEEMKKFPAYTFLNFCKNHGLLQVTDRPQWKTLLGGCNTYTLKVIETLDETKLNEGVLKIRSLQEGESGKEGRVEVVTEKGQYVFDAIFMGTHAPQTRKICGEIDKRIDDVLAKFSYQPNTAYLHTDANLLPKRKSAWSAWNYRSTSRDDHERAVSVSYLINKLQPLPENPPIVVTLNPLGSIEKSKIIKELKYEHPLFDEKAIQGQSEVPSIQGKHGIYYAGAWMRYGFHEDGIWAAKEALKQFNLDFLGEESCTNNERQQELKSQDAIL